MRTLPLVILQHAEEAAFLWSLRDRYVGEPHVRTVELSRLDSRVDAHLEGLLVGQDDAWGTALAQMEDHPEPGEVFVCAYVAFSRGNQTRIKRVLSAAAVPSNRRAVVSAIGWLADETKVEDYVLQFSFLPDPVEQAIGIAVGAIRRLTPGPWFQQALASANAEVFSRASRAVGELGLTRFASALKPMLSHKSIEARFWSSWTLALVGNDPGAITELRTIAMTERRYRRRAVEMACRRGDPRTTHKWLQGLEMLPGGLRFAINGYAALGDPVIVPRLLEWMREPSVARVASEAFANICGVHISYDNLEGAAPAGFEAGPTEKPADDDVSLDPDMNLYWPDVAKCADWWAKNQKNFAIGQRYLCGKPITIDSAREILKTGYQRQRAAAAIELAIREPGKPLYEVRAPGFRQK